MIRAFRDRDRPFFVFKYPFRFSLNRSYGKLLASYREKDRFARSDERRVSETREKRAFSEPRARPYF